MLDCNRIETVCAFYVLLPELASIDIAQQHSARLLTFFSKMQIPVLLSLVPLAIRCRSDVEQAFELSEFICCETEKHLHRSLGPLRSLGHASMSATVWLSLVSTSIACRDRCCVLPNSPLLGRLPHECKPCLLQL